MSRIAETFNPLPYAGMPGFKERGTSRDAALKFKTHVHKLSAHVLAEIIAAPNGLTADEVSAKLGHSVLSIRPRVSELREQNKIERVPGLRRKNASGMSAAVWRAKR